jgi:hypothetical protein
VLRATTPISTEDVVIGQYTGNVKNKGYKVTYMVVLPLIILG